MKESNNANVDRDDVQKGPGAEDQAKSMYLQALRRPYLLAEFSEVPSRSSRALHSLIFPNGTRRSSKKFRNHTRAIFPHDSHNHFSTGGGR